MIIHELLREIYRGASPFLSAQRKWIDNGYPHTNLLPEMIERVALTIRPSFWLEIGCMVGGSAIRTAQTLNSLAMPTEIVCMDPFTCGVDGWAWETKPPPGWTWDVLRFVDGRPSIYERFLANIVESGHHNRLLPITVTSNVGTRLLRRLHEEGRISSLPDVIYLDSAHEEDETFVELKTCWEILRPGTVLMGDDWDWPAIEKDVSRFCETIKPNLDLMREIGDGLPGSCIDERGVLLYKRQWLIAK